MLHTWYMYIYKTIFRDFENNTDIYPRLVQMLFNTVFLNETLQQFNNVCYSTKFYEKVLRQSLMKKDEYGCSPWRRDCRADLSVLSVTVVIAKRI